MLRDVTLYCPQCEYNLKGICEPQTPTGRCPECGEAFEREMLLETGPPLPEWVWPSYIWAWPMVILTPMVIVLVAWMHFRGSNAGQVIDWIALIMLGINGWCSFVIATRTIWPLRRGEWIVAVLVGMLFSFFSLLVVGLYCTAVASVMSRILATP